MRQWRAGLWGLAIAVGLVLSLPVAPAPAEARGKNLVVRKAILAPLPPRRPAGLVAAEPPAAKPPAIPDAGLPTSDPAKSDKQAGPSACIATFAARGGIALPVTADRATGACAIEDPVTFSVIAPSGGAKVTLDSAVTVDCAFALEVVDWVRDDLAAVLAKENATLAGLVGVGGHACRPRNRIAGERLSEHATGNALDLGGLRLGDGRTVSLTGREAATLSLRGAVQISACARFRTVLGPGSDGSHKDHIHLDMRKRNRDFKMCQWAVE